VNRGEEFVDQGQQRYEDQQLARSVAPLKRRATTLVFMITPVVAGT
jgi:transposase